MRAVVLDFYGTLTIAATTAERYEGHRLVAAALGIPVEAYADTLKRTWSERARGELGDLPATLRRLASACGADPTDEQLEAACEARREEQLRHVRLRESAVPMLRTLKERGIRTGLVSDCTHEVPEVWSSLPVAPYIDRPVFSVEAGMKKPDPAIFRLAAERLEVRPEDCLYVGDGDSRELPGAADVGMVPLRLLMPDHATGHVIDPIEWTGPTIFELSEVIHHL